MSTGNNIEEIESIGELKAYCREHHICSRCVHAHVCRVTAACDPSLLIVISHCLAFEEKGFEQTKNREA
jgi:hypothetical protein